MNAVSAIRKIAEEVEKLPDSEQQAKFSLLVSGMLKNIADYAPPTLPNFVSFLMQENVVANQLLIKHVPQDVKDQILAEYNEHVTELYELRQRLRAQRVEWAETKAVKELSILRSIVDGDECAELDPWASEDARIIEKQLRAQKS